MKRHSSPAVSLLVAAAMLYGCAALQNKAKEYAPDIKLLDINLAGLNFDGIDLNFKYQLKNKVSFPVTFTRLIFNLSADGKQVVNSDLPKGVSIPANGTTEFEIIHRLKFTDLADTLLETWKKDQVKVNLNGKTAILISQALGSVDVPFTAEKLVPVPKPPSISFKSLEYKSADLNPLNPKATFALNFNVKNPNIFDTKIATLNYGFKADNTNIVSGAMQNVAMPAGKEVPLTVPVNLKGADVITLVPKLRDFSKLNYNFAGDMNLDVLGNTVKIPYSYP